MPGRTYPTASNYRYAHNGQEKDDEIFEGALGAEFWEYDSRTGRRWESDPLSYSWQSPYATFNNNPLYFSDPSGLEGEGGDDKRGSGGDKKPTGDTQEKIDKENQRHEKLKDGRICYFDTKTGNTIDEPIKNGGNTPNPENPANTTGSNPPPPPPPKDNNHTGYAVYVAFPDAKASIGSSDKTFIASSARKLFGDVKLPVGHTGIIIGDGKGNTNYFDFGRFDHSPEMAGTGIVRTEDKIKGVNLIGGNSNEAKSIVKSLISGPDNYFGTMSEYKRATFAVYPGLNFDAMKSTADNYGNRPFGFGDGQSFCTQFVHDIINAGGGSLPSISDEIISHKVDFMKAIIMYPGNWKKIVDLDWTPSPANFTKRIRKQFKAANVGNNVSVTP